VASLAVTMASLAIAGELDADTLKPVTNRFVLDAPALADAARPERPISAGPVHVAALGPHPLDGLTPAELAKKVQTNDPSLGSASIGSPTSGGLWGGVQIQPSALLVPASPENAWATRRTVEALEAAVAQVHAEFARTPVLYVGDISRQRGGGLSPHRSHQSGLDVDLGYYYLDGPAWYQQATADNLDRARTWALVKALLANGQVDMIFMSGEVQSLLHDHAKVIGEHPVLLHELFESPENKRSVIRNVRGHNAHFHIRFADPEAMETARRLSAWLVRFGYTFKPTSKTSRLHRNRKRGSMP
jgi:penicillin-insensitive murein endopeptidase